MNYDSVVNFKPQVVSVIPLTNVSDEQIVVVMVTL